MIFFGRTCLSLARFHQAQATSSSPPGRRVQIPSKYVADMSSYPIVIFSLFWFSLHCAVLSNTPLGVPNIEKLSHVEKDEKKISHSRQRSGETNEHIFLSGGLANVHGP